MNALRDRGIFFHCEILRNHHHHFSKTQVLITVIFCNNRLQSVKNMTQNTTHKPDGLSIITMATVNNYG